MVGSIDGLISGMNTSQIIEQMMQLEARGQVGIQRQLSKFQATVAAYQALNTSALSLHTAAAALTKKDTWQAMKATSSSDAVTATASTGAGPGSITFDVTSLAKAASWSSTNAVALETDVRDGNPLVITKNGTAKTLTTTDDSLSSVISAINADSTLGVRAAAIQVRPGEYLLQLTSTTTGAGDISVSGLDAGIGSSAAAGTDAKVVLNVGGTTQEVTSSTNTFTGILPGVTFTASKLATGVTVDVVADGAAIADKVEAMVKAANAALDEIAKYTSYDANTKVGGPLMSDSTVRTVQQKILSAVSGFMSADGIAKDAGISLTKEGRLTFNRAAFLTAFEADPANLQRLVGPTGTFTPSVGGLQGTISFLGSTDRTVEGDYAVQITQAATRATADVTFSAIQAGDVLTVGNSAGTVTAAYTVQAGDTVDDVITGINAAASAQKLALSASSNGAGGITINATAYGSASTFTLTATGAATASAVTAGKDVVGFIAGEAATGFGQVLTAGVDATGGQAGLSVLVTLTPADLATSGVNVGTFGYAPGVGQRLASVAETASDPIDGTFTRAITSRNDTIKGLESQIEAWDRRLALRRQTLQMTFANLERALGKMRSQSDWLAGQLASLPTR